MASLRARCQQIWLPVMALSLLACRQPLCHCVTPWQRQKKKWALACLFLLGLYPHHVGPSSCPQINNILPNDPPPNIISLSFRASTYESGLGEGHTNIQYVALFQWRFWNTDSSQGDDLVLLPLISYALSSLTAHEEGALYSLLRYSRENTET